MSRHDFFILSSIIGTILFGICFKYSEADVAALYDCPSGWEEHIDHCYRFVRDPIATRVAAKEDCAIDGAYLLSVNDDPEHLFVEDTLDTVDTGQVKQIWWTSGRRKDIDSMEFYWEGDGSAVESYFYWHNDSIPAQTDREFIQYYYDSTKWGWILGLPEEECPFICEISKEDIYKIVEGDRGPDYGVDNPDEETIERGPKFTMQPVDTIFEPSSQKTSVELECIADAYPPPSYEWYHSRAGDQVKIDGLDNPRYTMINGKLIIHYPSTEMQDDGNYQCAALNKFGKIMSHFITLSFGFLQDFPKSPRAPVTVLAYGMASIECNPPAHYPSVLYTWYKDDIYNFVRPEVKPYIMISNDGRLYFSEVTTDDVGQYYCLVQKPGQLLAEGKISMPTELIVREGSPGVYEPEIGSGFPLIFPDSPLVGDDIRIECWASGSSTPPMVYFWDRIEKLEGNKERIIPLPLQSYMDDHNRVLIIPNVNLYDQGIYRCYVERLNGLTTNKTITLTLQARPYFVLDLKDQFADEGSELRWRCDAGGNPSVGYYWLKNGEIFDNNTMPDEDRGRVTVNENLIHFMHLESERDNGMYQCTADNNHGTRYSTAELRALRFAPSFAKYPLQGNQLGTEFGNTTMICRPEAAPYPLYEDILWYKDGQLMSPGDEDSNQRIIKMRNGNLYIGDLQTADAGVYRCHVTNPIASAETTGNLTILEETTITLPPRDDTIYVNRSRFIQCVASYNPQLDLTYVWYQNDLLIDFELVFRLGENKYEMWYNPHYRRGSGIYDGGLYIMHTQYWHAGKYTCEVESSSGIMTRDAYITVLGPPYEPPGVFHVDGTVTTNSVNISWKGSQVDLDMADSFVIEGLNHWEGFWKILHTNVRTDPDDRTQTYNYNVTNLRPYSLYELRLRAENELGTSGPSIPTDLFTTGAVKPDKYPEQVGGGGGRVGDLVITWEPLPAWEHNGLDFGYLVHYKDRGDEDWDKIIEVDGNVARHVILVGESNYYNEYEVAVRARNSEGEGPISPSVVIRSAMGLPTATAENVQAEPFNATACYVQWEPVSDTKDNMKGKLGGYRISYWMECCETEVMAPRVTINGQAEGGLVIGLAVDTPYYFDVMVWNDAGNGPKSQYFIQRTLRNPPIEPPVEVQVHKKSDHSIWVWWRGVSTNNQEEPLEGYKVRLWRDGEHIKVAKDYDAAKETDLYIDGLRHDVVYKLRVLGYSRAGDGTLSSPTQKFYLGAASHSTLSWAAIAVSFVCHILIQKTTS